TGSCRGTRAALVGILRRPASVAAPASPPRTVGTPVYGSPRSPRVAAGSLAADSRTVAGSQPARAAAPANADRRPFAADTGRSPDVPSPARRRVAPKPWLPSASFPPPASASAGLPLFCDHRLQRSFVQQQLGHGVLQLPVFLLQLPQSPRFAHFHPAVLRLPAVQAPACDPVPPAQLVG